MSIDKKWLAILASVFALCLLLVGCGSNEDASKNFIGDWKLVGMEEDGKATSKEDIKLMESFGMKVVMSFKEDKTFSLSFAGEEETGKWEAKSASEASLKVDGETVSVKLSDGELTLEQDGTKMIFERDKAESGSTKTDGGSSSS